MRAVARLFGVIGIALACATAGADSGCKPGDQECVNAAIAKLPVHRLSFWASALSHALDQRVGPASQDLIDFLELENLKFGYPNHPRAPKLTPRFMAEVQAAIDDLPAPVRRLAERKLIGVFLVEDLGGTGFTDVVQDDQGREVAGFIVLDAGVLASRTANAWATWKDGTPFKPVAQVSFSERIESDADDDTRNAIQYIFLHELGHVVSIGASLHPSWIVDPKDVGATDRFAFFNLSWTIDRARDRYATRFDAAFPERADVVYYFGAKLRADQMATVYDKLRQTNFATLYSVNTPMDDFAEAFANYVHTMLLHKPFEIRIASRAGTTTYSACWEELRCAGKRRLIEGLLQ